MSLPGMVVHICNVNSCEEWRDRITGITNQVLPVLQQLEPAPNTQLELSMLCFWSWLSIFFNNLHILISCTLV